MRLDHLPRRQLAHLPTPLEPLPGLTRALGGPEIWMKRDDATGLSTGGNKTRKLEYLMAEAIGRGADTVITIGAMQSNHARQTAAAAAVCGLRCDLILENRNSSPDPAYASGGNVLLDRILGANVIEMPAGTDLFTASARHADELRAAGLSPYEIPIGGSNAIGALGYVQCALELREQASDLALSISHVVHATASAGTQAGLVAGLAATGPLIPITGVSAGMASHDLALLVFDIADEVARMIEEPGCVVPDDVLVDDRWVGDGYGLPSEAMREAVELTARTEGVLLDPVYTGKAMAGLIAMIREGRFSPDDKVVFVHTGGVPGLFAYGPAFADD